MSVMRCGDTDDKESVHLFGQVRQGVCVTEAMCEPEARSSPGLDDVEYEIWNKTSSPEYTGQRAEGLRG